MQLKEYYEVMRKKDLPSFESVNSEFEIENIEEGNFALRIAEKIVNKIEKFRKIMESYLHADGSDLAVLMEIKALGEKDKEKMNSIYKELIVLEREFLIAEVDSKEEELFEFISKALIKWGKVKSQIAEIISKAKDSWKDDVKVIEELGYLG